MAGAGPRGVDFSTAVIPSLLTGQALSAAKDLRSAQGEILRCAQDDRGRVVPEALT